MAELVHNLKKVHLITVTVQSVLKGCTDLISISRETMNCLSFKKAFDVPRCDSEVEAGEEIFKFLLSCSRNFGAGRETWCHVRCYTCEELQLLFHLE